MITWWVWASEHWFLGFILMAFAVQCAATVLCRIVRMVMVLARGWPTPLFMDADGDVVRPIQDKS